MQISNLAMKHAFTIPLCALLMSCSATYTEELPRASLVQYRLAPGDKLRLDIFREENLSGEYVIDANGYLSLPMAGNVMAARKTLPELSAELSRIFSENYVRNAKISLEIANYRPIYILGEIQRPGEYSYTEGMSIFALVAKAGGFTYRANQSLVYIRHSDDSLEHAYRLTSGAAALPGDTVRISPRFF